MHDQQHDGQAAAQGVDAFLLVQPPLFPHQAVAVLAVFLLEFLQLGLHVLLALHALDLHVGQGQQHHPDADCEEDDGVAPRVLGLVVLEPVRQADQHPCQGPDHRGLPESVRLHDAHVHTLAGDAAAGNQERGQHQQGDQRNVFSVHGVWNRIDQGTGSAPPLWKGWHRRMRPSPIQPPRHRP